MSSFRNATAMALAGMLLLASCKPKENLDGGGDDVR